MSVFSHLRPFLIPVRKFGLAAELPRAQSQEGLPRRPGDSRSDSGRDLLFFVLAPVVLIASAKYPPTLRLLERPPIEYFHKVMAISNRVPVIRREVCTLRKETELASIRGLDREK